MAQHSPAQQVELRWKIIPEANRGRHLPGRIAVPAGTVQRDKRELVLFYCDIIQLTIRGQAPRSVCTEKEKEREKPYFYLYER